MVSDLSYVKFQMIQTNLIGNKLFIITNKGMVAYIRSPKPNYAGAIYGVGAIGKARDRSC